MKLFTLLLLLVSLHDTGFSQNLILNPGLEDRDTSNRAIRPYDIFAQRDVPGWYNPGSTTTDFFMSDGKHDDYGSRYFSRRIKAHGGHSYGGIYIDNTKWKEYIGIELKEPLVQGKNYRLEMYLSISNRSKYGAASLQVNFWDTNYVMIGGVTGYPRMSPTYPSVVIRNTGQQKMVGDWVKVSADFTALGGERSFVLGFLSDLFQTAPLALTPVNRNNDPYTYYYIDDVSLVQIEGSPIPRVMPSRPIIYFDVNSAVIKPQFYLGLDSVVSRLKADALLKVNVNGFTDSTGTDALNLGLSVRRAEAVAGYLVSKGIDPVRITANGYSETRPAGEDKALNRRVEFVFSRQ